MASSASGQYAANSVLWLATRAGKKERYCPPGTARFVHANKISLEFKQVHISFLSPKLFFAKVKRFFSDFSVFMGPEKASTRMKTKKTKMLMSFKNKFCNKNRQTQKFVLNLKIWNLNFKCNRSTDCIFCIYPIRYRVTRHHFII